MGGDGSEGAPAPVKAQHVPLPRPVGQAGRPVGRSIIPAVGDDYPTRVSELKAKRNKNLAMGGDEKIKKQHERGKLSVRERIDLLFDKDTFVEFGLLAHQQQVRGNAEIDPDGWLAAVRPVSVQLESVTA